MKLIKTPLSHAAHDLIRDADGVFVLAGARTPDHTREAIAALNMHDDLIEFVKLMEYRLDSMDEGRWKSDDPIRKELEQARSLLARAEATP